MVVSASRTLAVTWNNGAGNGRWSTIDTNWTGFAWNNAQPYSALFTTVGGTINVAQPITAGSVTMGDISFNAPNVTLTNGSLTASNLTVQGYNSNAGTYYSNPTLTLAVPTVSVSGDIAVGRATLVISSGTVSAKRIISSAASADWGDVVINGGTVTATNGVDGSVNTAATFQLDLNGGALYTPFIKVADREMGAGNNAWLNFNGTVVHPTVSTNNFITLYGGNQNTYVGNGGVNFSTDGRNIGIGVNLVAYGNGGLTKSGSGTLTLSGQNSYLGTTRVLGGVLSVANSSALPVSSVIDITNGAMVNLNFTGNTAVGGLRLNGVMQPAGVYGAVTHPAFFTGGGHLAILPPSTNALANAANDGVSNFRRMKYGFFVHYVFGGVRKSDGNWPNDANDLADRFDAAGFADDLQSMGVEYLIFTAWHFNVVCLWPSTAMNQWMPGHTVNRDLVSDMIDAVRAKGIRVFLYTHPRDGHDMSTADQITTGWGPGSGGYDPDWNQFNRQKWNDFINDIYADLINRYGSRIDGLFIDEGSPLGNSYSVVDYPRLRQTIKSRQPNLLMMHNYYGNNYSCDIGATEVSYWQAWVPGTDPNNWPATGRPMSMVMGGNWSAITVPGIYAPRYNATEMFRMTVLRAGVNSTDGGGVNWAAGPYAGGGWETGVLEQMRQIGSWIAPIRRSICNTLPSQSWITPPNATINSLANGIVATRAFDDGTEFVHVLTPPATNSITLPAPADGRGYSLAYLLANGNPVTLVRNTNGSITLTLQSGDAWDSRNTVIALKPVTVTWNGNSNDAGPGTAAWSEGMDNFSNGVPVSTRFRSGDNVDFSSLGATNVLPWVSSFNIGDLRFAGKNYQIQPSGSPTLTLSSGRINVTNGIIATFNQNGSGGPLTLAGSEGLQKTGDGTLVLNLVTTYTGNTIVGGGILKFASGGLGAGDNIVFQGGTLAYLAGNSDDISARIHYSQSPVAIDTGGNNVLFATPLGADNSAGLTKLGAGTLSLAGGTHSFSGPIAVAAGTLRLDPGTAATVTITNSGFESPAYAAAGWSYNPTSTGWTFSSTSGTARNGSPWVGNSPEGVQAAFIQNAGTMSCSFNVAVAGAYVLAFKAANRPGYVPSGLVITVDSKTILTLSPGQIGQGGDFNLFQSPAFALTAGTHSLVFQGLQNGVDSDTLIDAVSLTGAGAGSLASGAALQLTGVGAGFVAGTNSQTLASLTGVAGTQILLTNTALIISSNDPVATFAGNIAGTGSVTINGTLRLVGNAQLSFSGGFTNNGVLDLLTWKGTLSPGFVNNGIVLDRSNAVISSCAVQGDSFIATIPGYSGHNYQLQFSDSLSGSWQNIGAPQPGAGVALNFTNLVGAATTNRFYRIQISP